jgi:hypothetical protein
MVIRVMCACAGAAMKSDAHAVPMNAARMARDCVLDM